MRAVEMPLNLFFTVITFAALTALSGPANAQAQSLEIICTASPLDDWPAQRLITDDRILCRAEGYDIRIEMTGTNRILSHFTSDGSHIFRTFRTYQQDERAVQPVTLHTLEFSDNVIEFYLNDGDGVRISNLHRQFIWSRDMSSGSPFRRSDSAVV